VEPGLGWIEGRVRGLRALDQGDGLRLFLHLNDYAAFKKVLPSKIFEYAAMGKPLWAGVAGFSAEFITQQVSNAAVFHPCDVDDAIRALGRLALEDGPRTEFLAEYSSASVSARLADDILTLGP
jgi:hypothetical protein